MLSWRACMCPCSAATNIFIHGNDEQGQLTNEVRFLWSQNQILKEQLNMGSRGKRRIFNTCSFWYTSVQPVDKHCWSNNIFPDIYFLNLSPRRRSTLTYRCFDFLQTSRRRTRSYGRLWPGGRPNWSRAGRSAKLWGKKTADCRRGWSTAAKKTPSCRTHCTTARRSCTGTHTQILMNVPIDDSFFPMTKMRRRWEDTDGIQH